MDPTEALKDVRSLSERVRTTEQVSDNVGMLIDTVEGLDEWISKGGFLPDQWRNVRRGRPRRVGDGPKVLTGRRHGLRSTYNAGCQCEKCTAANREWAAAYRTQQKETKES